MFDETQQQAFNVVSITFNALSFLSCLWLFYLYIKSPSRCSAQFKMLVNLTLSDFMISISGFITHFSPKNNRTCSTFIFFSLASYWSSAFWSSIVAIFSYKKIATTSNFNSDKFYNYALVLWVLLCVVLPFLPVFNILGIEYIENDDFCAISFTKDPLLLFMLSEGAPLIVAILVTAISYIRQIRVLRNLPDFILTRINIKAGKLYWYSIAQCLVFVPGFICHLVYILTLYNSFATNLIRLYGFRLAGVVNSVVYGLQRVKLRKSQDSLIDNDTQAESVVVQETESFSDYEEKMRGDMEKVEFYH